MLWWEADVKELSCAWHDTDVYLYGGYTGLIERHGVIEESWRFPCIYIPYGYIKDEYIYEYGDVYGRT